MATSTIGEQRICSEIIAAFVQGLDGRARRKTGMETAKAPRGHVILPRFGSAPCHLPTAAVLPTRYGAFQLIAYSSPNGKEHVALTVGVIDDAEPVLVRLHSECLTDDVFGSRRCDCGTQLEERLDRHIQRGRGLIRDQELGA